MSGGEREVRVGDHGSDLGSDDRVGRRAARAGPGGGRAAPAPGRLPRGRRCGRCSTSRSRSASAIWFAMAYGGDLGTQYFAGYIVEKSLSVDNLFVFVIIMSTFAVPAEHQHKVLTYGIVLALVLRAIFIALGATLLSLFSFMFLLFGLLLIYTAVQLFRHRDEDPDVEDNVVVNAARRFLPLSDQYDGGKIMHAARRPPGVHTDVRRAAGHRQHRPAVRARLDPRGVRRDRAAVHRLRRQRLRPARPAGAVLPGQGPARPAGVPVHRARADPGLHRRQADPALGARGHLDRGAGDLHPGQPGRDRRGAGRGHGGQPGQDPRPPGNEGARRLDHRAQGGEPRPQPER